MFCLEPGSRAATFSLGLALLVLGVTPVDAARVFDPSILPRARYVAPLAPYPAPSYRAKDFAIVRKGSWYHLFYTRVQRFVPTHWSDGTRTILNETTFGHAISADLETWFDADTVFTASKLPEAWDEHHLWAPTIVEQDGVTWMLFTGVRDRQQSAGFGDWIPRWQVIGAAYSVDPLLMEWTRVLQPIWGPCGGPQLPGVSWALCSPNQWAYAADFRDPYVLAPRAGTSDPWLLFYTARVRWDAPNYVVGLAQAPSPAGPWTDAGGLWDTYYPPLNSKVESPHVFRRGNDLHMLFSGDDGSTGIAWHVSHGTPGGPWTAQPRLNEFLKDAPDHPYEFNLEPEAWFASEVWSEPLPGGGNADYLAVVHSYDAPTQYNPPPPQAGEDISTIEFRRIVWDQAGTAFTLVAPNPVRAMRTGSTTVQVGATVNLEFDAEGGEGTVVQLSVRATSPSGTVTLHPASVGLPAIVLGASATTVVPWTVADPGFGAPLTLELVVANQPMRHGRTIAVTGTVGSGDAPFDPPIARQVGFRETRLFARAAGANAVRPELVIELGEPGPVTIALYDVTGRLVRTLADGDAFAAGTRTFAWDGLDAAGRPAPRGVYFARATTSRDAVSARVVLAR